MSPYVAVELGTDRQMNLIIINKGILIWRRTRVQIVDKAVCRSLRANTLEKGLDPSVLRPARCTWQIKLVTLILVSQPV